MADPASTTQEGVVGVEVPEQARGREVGRAQGKSRGKSKASSIDVLEPRVATLEASMSAVQDTLDNVEVRVDGLEGEYGEFSLATKALVQDHADSLRGELRVLHDELLNLRSFVQDELRMVRAEVDEVRSDWAWHKRTLTPSPAPVSSSDARRIDVPKPDTYDGVRNATVVDNFLFGLEQYFDAMGVRDEASKVGTAPTFLRGAAQLWWRRKHGEMGKGICTISTWAEFQQELRKHFAPRNAEKEARARLRRLKQTGNVRDYINDFTTLMLEITDMSDKDSLFYFQDGLKDWAKAELDRRGVQTLDDAIAVAESLADYSASLKDKRPSHDMGGGETHEDKGQDLKEKRPPASDKSGQGKSEKIPKPRSPCFICNGPHWARDCPEKKSLSALAAQLKGHTTPSTEEPPRSMGSLQRLSALQSQPPTAARKGLMFVSALINGHTVRALLDTGATHNFVSEDEAKRLGLKPTSHGGTIKAVNSPAEEFAGTARGIHATLGTWNGKLDFSIVPMDDYSVILGMEFFDKVHAFPIPATNSLSIVDGSKACVVPVERAQPAEKALSVMRCRRGFKRNPSHSVSIPQLDEGEDSETPPSQVPRQARDVRAKDKGKDEMPPKLPTLPLRQVVERHAKQPAKAPSSMAPHKHEELRKHKRGRRNTKWRNNASGEASLRTKDTTGVHSEPRSKSKCARRRSRRGRREHRWGRIVTGRENLSQSEDNSAHTRSPPRHGVR